MASIPSIAKSKSKDKNLLSPLEGGWGDYLTVRKTQVLKYQEHDHLVDKINRKIIPNVEGSKR